MNGYKKDIFNIKEEDTKVSSSNQIENTLKINDLRDDKNNLDINIIEKEKNSLEDKKSNNNLKVKDKKKSKVKKKSKIEIIKNNKLFNIEELPTVTYTKQDLINIKDNIKTGGLVFEHELIQALNESILKNGENFNAKSVIAFYLDKAQNAKKVNHKTGDMIPDEETRMKAMDKLVKIMTGNNGASKGITVNVNNTTNNLWTEIPKPGDKLIY